MKYSKIKKTGFYQRVIELLTIGNRGVQMALAENKRKGLPNVVSINKTICYQMPDGTITTKSSFKKKKASSKKNRIKFVPIVG